MIFFNKQRFFEIFFNEYIITRYAIYNTFS